MLAASSFVTLCCAQVVTGVPNVQFSHKTGRTAFFILSIITYSLETYSHFVDA